MKFMKPLGCISTLLTILLTGCGSSDADFVRLAQKSVQEQLTDPDSAKFGEVFVVPHPDGSTSYKHLRYVCGSVNAKNAFGGYAGASRFVVLVGVPSAQKEPQALDTRLEKNPGDNLFSITAWDVDCKRV